MSTVSRVIDKIKEKSPGLGSTKSVLITTGLSVKNLISARAALVVFAGFLGYLGYTGKIDLSQAPKKPDVVAQAPVPTPAPEVKVEAPAPAPIPVPEVKPEAPAPVTEAPPVSTGDCIQHKQGYRVVTVPVYRKYYGFFGEVYEKREYTSRRMAQTEKVVVPCPPDSVLTPAAPEGAVMFGLKGLGGIFDEAAFKEFATSRGYKPVVLKEWTSDSAKDALVSLVGKMKVPYAIYGFSIGAQTARDALAGLKDNPPVLVVTVGTSSVVSLKDKFPNTVKVENYFHEGTQHDSSGIYINAPHTGKDNIQQIVAKMAKQPPVAETPATK